jgi:hypothetical protein
MTAWFKHKKVTYLPLVLLIAILTTPFLAKAETFEVKGTARVRSESKSDTNFSDTAGNHYNFTGSRFRVDMKFTPNEKLYVFFQPQFTKVWGEPEQSINSLGAITAPDSSGATNDTGLDVHQAFINYSVSESLSLAVGRKELNHGDQLLVGALAWSNVGRSFDLVQGTYRHGYGTVEAFNSKIKDTNVSVGGPGDRDFSGLYSANNLGDYFQNVDAYVYYLGDKTVIPSTSVLAYGIRLKSPVGPLDYRLEATAERVASATDTTNENQADVELGYTFHEGTKSRFSAEYFVSSNDFNQLYPTAHKWLGYADLFGRRNIKGFRVGVSTQVSEKWSMALDYHDFRRTDTGTSIFKLDGTTGYGVVGTDTAVASEIDFVVGYKVDQGISLEAGASRADPGAYLKQNGGSAQSAFYYLQVSSAF